MKFFSHSAISHIKQRRARKGTIKMVKEVKSKAEFDKMIEEAGDKLVVIDFYATWCGPCKIISPVVDKFAKKFKGQVIFLKVDVDEKGAEELVNDFKIEIMPTFVFQRNGKTIGLISGSNEQKLLDKIEKLLKA